MGLLSGWYDINRYAKNGDIEEHSQAKSVGGVETIEWYDMLSLIFFIYSCPQLNLAPDPLNVLSHGRGLNAKVVYLHVFLVFQIDGAYHLDPHIFTMEEPSLVHFNVRAAHRGCVARPLDLSRVELAIGWKLIGQTKQVVKILGHTAAFLF